MPDFRLNWLDEDGRPPSDVSLYKLIVVWQSLTMNRCNRTSVSFSFSSFNFRLQTQISSYNSLPAYTYETYEDYFTKHPLLSECP